MNDQVMPPTPELDHAFHAGYVAPPWDPAYLAYDIPALTVCLIIFSVTLYSLWSAGMRLGVAGIFLMFLPAIALAAIFGLVGGMLWPLTVLAAIVWHLNARRPAMRLQHPPRPQEPRRARPF